MHHQPRIRVSGMIWKDDHLLLVRQGRPGHPRWMLPGGGVEAGESLVTALERELAEELGLNTCEVGQPQAMVESIAPPASQSSRHLLHVIFLVDCPSQMESLTCKDPDIREWRFFERSQLMTVPLHPPIAGWLVGWSARSDFIYLGQLWAP